MATLKPFLGPHGGHMKIWLYGLVQHYVGGGSFTEVTDFTARFSGSYDYLTFKGPVNVVVELKDRNPNATSGPCSLTVMDNTDPNATYQVDGNNLMVNTRLNKDPIKVYPYKKGTEFDYPTLPAPLGSIGIWIGP